MLETWIMIIVALIILLILAFLPEGKVTHEKDDLSSNMPDFRKTTMKKTGFKEKKD